MGSRSVEFVRGPTYDLRGEEGRRANATESNVVSRVCPLLRLAATEAHGHGHVASFLTQSPASSRTRWFGFYQSLNNEMKHRPTTIHVELVLSKASLEEKPIQ